MNFNFTNQTVIITGAAGALGSTVAELFFRAGANLALVDISFQKTHTPALETCQKCWFI